MSAILKKNLAAKTLAPRRGTVLLLALLVLSSVVIASSGLGSLILNSLQQARIIDSSIMAYYAAEGAAEEALYSVRKVGLGETWEQDLTVSPASPVKLHNGTTWFRTVTGKEQLVNTSIPRDSFYEVALYDPDQEAEPLDEQMNIVRLDWSSDPCEGDSDICPSLLVTLVRWDPTSEIWAEDATTTIRFVSDADGETPNKVVNVDPDYLYRMRLRAEDGDIRDVRVTAYTDEAQGIAVDLPGRIRIDSYGTFGSTRQHLAVRLPRQTPLSGLYDFALFSECSLVKGYPISCP
jgi:hypothetical protein